MLSRSAFRLPLLALTAFSLVTASCGSEPQVAIESSEPSVETEAPITADSASDHDSATSEGDADQPGDDETADGETADGETSDGDSTDGDSTDGDSTESDVATEAMVCQYDPDKGGPNPFGMRTFLRFEDRELGGSAMVFESFGNAVGDGSYWWQSVFPSEAATSLYADVLDGDLPIEELLGPDGASRTEIEAVFTCGPVEGPTPTYDDYTRPEIPASGPRCLFDPERGDNQIGLRSSLSVYEIKEGGSPIGSGVLYENFGNAAGDGAGYHLDVFLDLDPEQALDAYLRDPAYYAQSIGYPDETETADIIDQIKLSHPCSSS